MRGNKSPEIIREVVVRDSTPPMLHLIGEATVYLEAGSAYSDEGATAIDLVDGNLSENIEVDFPSGILAPGEYYVKYDVSDLSGNRADQLIRIIVVQDTISPVMQLKGEAIVYVEAGREYVDEGVSATDSFEGDLSAKAIVSNPVDSREIGSYEVTYNVADASGNKAVELSRT